MRKVQSDTLTTAVMAEPFPEPPEAGVLNALRFGTEPVRFLEGIQSRFADGTRVPIPGRAPLVILTHPSLVHEALGRPAQFERVPVPDSASLLAERGLVQTEGELWKQQRSIMTPAFSGPQVATYAHTTGQRVSEVKTRWMGGGEREVNLHREMTVLTVRVASEILLGADLGRERARRFHDLMQVVGKEFEFGLDILTPAWFPECISPEFRQVAREIRGQAEEMIEQRRATLPASTGDGPTDVLSLLLRAEQNPEVAFRGNQIRDEVTTLLIAGHETTALSLSYTLSLLSQHREWRRRVRREARAVLGTDPPSLDHVEDLTVTERAYREALRLYPPAWAVFRRADGDDQLGEYQVEDGSAVVLPQWSIHRDGRYFERPETFDPARWERRDPTDVDAYFPFATGPHACIGRQFALAGAPLTLAGLVRDFDIDVPDRELDDLRVTPTLRPRDGISATVRPAQ